jgi:hypothetical protein
MEKYVRKNIKSGFDLMTFMLEETTNEVRDFINDQCVRLLALAPVVSNFIAYPFQQAANS